MKTKSFILIAIGILFINCSDDDECSCQGEFEIINEDEGIVNTIVVPNVNCETGVLQSGSAIPALNSATFIGCSD